jgi:hypothetical protein
MDFPDSQPPTIESELVKFRIRGIPSEIEHRNGRDSFMLCHASDLAGAGTESVTNSGLRTEIPLTRTGRLSFRHTQFDTFGRKMFRIENVFEKKI